MYLSHKKVSMSIQYWGLLMVSLNLNFNKISVSILMIEFMSILLTWLLEFSYFYFFINFRLSLSSMFFIDDIDEMFVFELDKEYTIYFMLYFVVEVEVEVKPLRWAMDYFIFWLILDWLDFSRPCKLILSSKQSFLAMSPSSILSASRRQVMEKSLRFLMS